MRLFVSLSYNGTPFCGWQLQPNAPSVQETLERALSITFGEKVAVVGAGRTDTGVNARNYIAHFDVQALPSERTDWIIHKINAILPREVVVNSIFRATGDAHARFDAVSRTYRYYVHTVKDPFAVHSLYFRFPLDIEKMNTAARCLLGRHDFSSFEKVGGANLTSFCTVSEAFWKETGPGHFVFTITADRFLRNMVRATVGTLLEIGGGKHSPEWIEEVLLASDRGAAGQSVAGEALFLEKVEYPYPLVEL
ncbi:MAG: tRNA pseudouridine(38-40) synthase TruA [Bacteroidales bacterium]|nr:tRNA pseudouridine(38-40) synthase TruA [Candidatus Cacconaster merdequi]